MTSLTSALRFFQPLDRALVFLGYSAEITAADLRGDNIHFALRVAGSIYNPEYAYATAELSIEDSDSDSEARVRDVTVDFYPSTKDELVREINAALPDKVGELSDRPLDVARVLARQFEALGLEPAGSIGMSF